MNYRIQRDLKESTYENVGCSLFFCTFYSHPSNIITHMPIHTFLLTLYFHTHTYKISSRVYPVFLWGHI